MNHHILVYLPYIISFFIGYFLITLVDKKKHLSCGLHYILAAGLGLGVSAQVCFYGLIIFGQNNNHFNIIANLSLLTIFFGLCLWRVRGRAHHLIRFEAVPASHIVIYILFLVTIIPLWSHCQFYAYGGWDAWSTWNLKAKMISFGGEYWQNLLDPVLWRSSPHYPLQQPLTNVWGWSFLDFPNFKVPIFTTFWMTFLTLALLLFSLLHLTKSVYALLATSVLSLLPYFVKISLSQYADNMVGFYLFAAFLCLILSRKYQSVSLAFLSGMLLGLLSFTKNEGLAACGIITVMLIPYYLTKSKINKRMIFSFFSALLICSLSTIIFRVFYQPENQSLLNGLTSDLKPLTFYRVKAIYSFYVVEFMSLNWNGLWIVLTAGILLSKFRCFNRTLIIIPLFIFSYIAVVTGYYLFNTYFDILWWLQVSLHRIVYALFPLVMFWIFYGLFDPEGTKDAQS